MTQPIEQVSRSQYQEYDITGHIGSDQDNKTAEFNSSVT